MVHGWPYKEFQKIPIYQFWLLVTEINPSCGWLPMWLYHKIQRKKKKKKQNLGIILKYDKNLFSLKLHFPKKLLDFGFFRDKKLRMNICYLKIWGQKIGKSRPEKTRKHQLPPTLINPKVIEVFEDCILKGWGSAECRNRYCVFSCPHLQH
jgi:hypothetical protein